MAKHNEFGQISEDLASAYLMSRGYTIRERNWRLGHKEVDIIAQKDSVLAFVEVKARRTDTFGDAIDAVSEKKIRNIISVASAYVKYYRLDLSVRVDVIAITGEPGNQTIEHIEDAFYPSL